MAGEELIASGIIELAKLGAQIYFQAAREANLTEEQARQLLESEREKFNQRNPADLTDV